MIKVYLDDERETLEGWKRAYTAPQCIEFLKTGKVDELSLDHDLGEDPAVGTGYDVVLWLEREVFLNKFIPPAIYVHSANSSAREKMKAGIRKIVEYAKKNEEELNSEPAPVKVVKKTETPSNLPKWFDIILGRK